MSELDLGATVTALRGRVFSMTNARPHKAVTVAPTKNEVSFRIDSQSVGHAENDSIAFITLDVTDKSPNQVSRAA